MSQDTSMETAYYSEASQATVRISDMGVEPSAPKVDNEDGSRIANWGDNNLFPQEVYKESRKNTLIGSTLDDKANALNSSLVYGRMRGYDKEGNRIIEPVYSPQEEDFIEGAGVFDYLDQACSDFYWFYNVFPELILSKDKKKFTHVTAQKAMYCRWEKQNNKGQVPNCFINANWHNSPSVEDATTITVKTLNHKSFTLQQDIQKAKVYKYMYQLSYPTPAESYYSLATWNSIIESGWLKFANSIPRFKERLMQNQLHIKYHIEINKEYMKVRYKDWDKLEQSKREYIIKEMIGDFNKKMKGDDNAGSSLMTFFGTDIAGKKVPGWEVTPIEGAKHMDGAYQEDGLTANQHILFALGMPSTLKGAPGKSNMGGGSGSDVREHWNAYLAKTQSHQRKILEPINFMRRYNGMPKDIIYYFKPTILRTLNTVSPKDREQNAEN